VGLILVTRGERYIQHPDARIREQLGGRLEAHLLHQPPDLSPRPFHAAVL
jgi:hypothetical protein